MGVLRNTKKNYGGWHIVEKRSMKEDSKGEGRRFKVRQRVKKKNLNFV